MEHTSGHDKGQNEDPILPGSIFKWHFTGSLGLQVTKCEAIQPHTIFKRRRNLIEAHGHQTPP